MEQAHSVNLPISLFHTRAIIIKKILRSFIRSVHKRDNLGSMSADILDILNDDVVEYLEGVSDPEKVRLSKRWDKDKDHQTHGLSAHDYTAHYAIRDLKGQERQEALSIKPPRRKRNRILG